MHCSGGLGAAQVVWACFEFHLACFEFCLACFEFRLACFEFCLACFEFHLACFACALPASAILGLFGHSLVCLGTA